MQVSQHIPSQQHLVELINMIHKGLMNSLGSKSGGKGCDVVSKISDVSNHTGDANTRCGSTVNSEVMATQILHTGEYAKQLVDSCEKNPDKLHKKINARLGCNGELKFWLGAPSRVLHTLLEFKPLVPKIL